MQIEWMNDESWESVKAISSSFDLTSMNDTTGEIGITKFLNIDGMWYAQRVHGECMRILPLVDNEGFTQTAAYLAVRLLEIEDEADFEQALKKIQEITQEWLKSEFENLGEL